MHNYVTCRYFISRNTCTYTVIVNLRIVPLS